MTDTQTPEPTPAVARSARAARMSRTGYDWHLVNPETQANEIRVQRDALAAALATECHEAVVPDWADGEEQPCNAYAVAYREDVVGDAVLGVYPVCEEHARPPLVPLTTAILGSDQ